jgi:hypothetical protein
MLAAAGAVLLVFAVLTAAAAVTRALVAAARTAAVRGRSAGGHRMSLVRDT